MKTVSFKRRANHAQIAKLSAGETAFVIEFAALTAAPVLVERAQVGTSVRPEEATIVNGFETVESFLKRGGSIKVAKPTKVTEPTIRVKGSRNMANTMLAGARAVKSIEEVK